MALIPALPRHRLLLVFNPVAGRGRAARRAAALDGACRALGAETFLAATRGPGDARILARGNGCGADACVVLGGDGTVAEALNGAADAAGDGRPPLPVAVAPSGTANVLASFLGIPAGRGRRALGETARLAVWGPCRPLDLVSVTSLGPSAAGGADPPRRCFLCAGCGFDAEVVDRVHRARRGTLSQSRYLRPALAALFRRRPGLAVTVDGRELAGDATFVMVGNVNSYGGHFRFFGSGSRPDDGRLDVRAMRGRGLADWLRFGWRAWRGKWPEGDPRAPCLGGRRVEVRPADPARTARYQTDGDPGGDLPAAFEILPGAGRVVAPDKAPA